MFGDISRGRIYIFYGKMGSGKTTNALREVVRFYMEGRPVWVNFPIAKLPTRKKGADVGVWFEDDPEGILSMRHGLFVIDEAYMTLNSREWASLSKKVFTAFTHVRKLNMTVIVIAQSWMRIDKSIREVSSVARQFHGGSFMGKLYNYTEYAIDEMGEIIKGEEVEYATAHKGFSFIRSRVYESFDTNHLFDTMQEQKRWPSAIGYKPAAGTPAASGHIPAPLIVPAAGSPPVGRPTSRNGGTPLSARSVP